MRYSQRSGGNRTLSYQFLYLNRETLPSEDEQYETYRKVAERVRPNPLIIRTFDLGGDKLAAGAVDTGDELNPFLGWRAISVLS